MEEYGLCCSPYLAGTFTSTHPGSSSFLWLKPVSHMFDHPSPGLEDWMEKSADHQFHTSILTSLIDLIGFNQSC